MRKKPQLLKEVKDKETTKDKGNSTGKEGAHTAWTGVPVDDEEREKQGLRVLGMKIMIEGFHKPAIECILVLQIGSR